MGACETTPATLNVPGEAKPATFRSNHPRTQAGSSSLLMIGRRLPASSSFVLARALPARRCGRSSLTPPTRRHNPAATRKAATGQSHPNPAVGDRVTGSIQHGPLTSEAPMGAVICLRYGPGEQRHRSQPWGFKSLSDTRLRTC
jgi:hypothetical protein